MRKHKGNIYEYVDSLKIPKKNKVKLVEWIYQTFLDGFEEGRREERESPGGETRTVLIPRIPGFLPSQILKTIIKQSGLTVKEFKKLLNIACLCYNLT